MSRFAPFSDSGPQTTIVLIWVAPNRATRNGAPQNNRVPARRERRKEREAEVRRSGRLCVALCFTRRGMAAWRGALYGR